MNLKQIVEIQKEARKLETIANKMFEAFPSFPDIAIISVCLQNIAFHPIVMDLEAKSDEIGRKRELIQLISEYDENNHFVKYLYQQFDMAFTSAIMSID